MRTTIISAFAFFLTVNALLGFPILTCKNQQYILFDPETGRSTHVGSADLKWGWTNFQYLLDEGARYAFMLGDAEPANPEDPFSLPRLVINVTDLVTKESRNFFQPDIPSFGGFFRGKLVLSTRTGYYSFDPDTGIRQFLTASPLEDSLNFQFVVDPDTGLAYELGTTSAGRGVAVTNLATGKSRFIREAKLPIFGGFFNGRLVVAYDTDFYAYDPVTGKGDYLASSPLKENLNFQFSVDGRSGYAYMMGTSNGGTYISATSLITGESRIIREGDPDILISKLYPEVAALSSRRRETSRRPGAALDRFWGSRTGIARVSNDGANQDAKVTQKARRFRSKGMKLQTRGAFPDGSQLVTQATFSPGGGYYASIRRNGKIVDLVTGSWRLAGRSTVKISETGQGDRGSFRARSKLARTGSGTTLSSSRSDGTVFGWNLR